MNLWSVGAIENPRFYMTSNEDVLVRGNESVHRRDSRRVLRATLFLLLVGRGVTVLFGGESSRGPSLGDTWEWDGQRWENRQVYGPGPRYAYIMVYDSKRDVSVLFGGVNHISFFGDTWEWDGHQWIERTAVDGVSPIPRIFAAAAFDSKRGVLVMFGGEDANRRPLDDTWEWNGNSWKQLQVTGPSARFGHAMTFDSKRNCVVLHGGAYRYNGFFGDTWEWDGKEWNERTPSNNLPRAYHSMTFDVTRNVTVLFGGRALNSACYTGYGCHDTWEWDGDMWREQPEPNPLPEANGAMVFDANRSVLVLVGSSVLWERIAGEWVERSGDVPTVTTPELIYDRKRVVTVLVANPTDSPTLQTWELNGTVWRMRDVEGPPTRRYFSVAQDTFRDVIVLHGGANSDTGEPFGDTWEWDGASWVLKSNSGPLPEHSGPIVFDSRRRLTVMLAGGNADSMETWEWNGQSWKSRGLIGPPPRSILSLAFDSRRGVCVLFAGIYGSPNSIPPTETWEFDGTSWELRGSNGPEARLGGATVFDERERRTILFGGMDFNYKYRSDLWSWDGATWQLMTVGQLPGRFSMGMAYDADREEIVLFGGNSAQHGFDNETWELSDDRELTFDGNGDCQVNLADFAELENCYESRRLGHTCREFDVNKDGFVNIADVKWFLDAVFPPGVSRWP
ncbi:MAG: hypothetical protein HYR83_08465 [Planctomycetes bacterium]|nr:hypothetical protein [Planctomycetota bacterium]